MLQVIDGKKTEWEGLWWHPEYASFSSACISLGQLRKFKGNVRLIMKKNKFFNSGENGRPNYIFMLCDSKSEKYKEIEVCDLDDDDADDLQKKYCFSYDELQRLINLVACEAGGSGEYGEHLVSDFIDVELTGKDTCLI